MLSLAMDTSVADGFKSGSQIARRVTEAWGEQSLYCAACKSDFLKSTPNNTAAVDFLCPSCEAGYQLKASRQWNTRRVPDAGYDAMVRAVKSDAVPNLLVMQYDAGWTVRNLLLIPSFFFSLAAVERRKPLAPTARRAGWVGCNIRLDAISTPGKLSVVDCGRVTARDAVRSQYEMVRPLAHISVRARGWTLDVLRLIQHMGKRQFATADAYMLEGELSRLYPLNRNVRAKIRQQLQVLRDMGLLRFESHGCYSLS